MPNPKFPADYVLDLHDLAALILDCHRQTDSRFEYAQLVEINRGDTPLITLPETILPPEWYEDVQPGQKRVAYILKCNPDAPERVSIDNFAAQDGVKVPGNRSLTRRELEDVYWRCKNFDNGYLLTYVAQSVIEALPATAKLRARTSTGLENICSPADVVVAEIQIQPKEACLMVPYEPKPELGPSRIGMNRHLSGFGDPLPWIYLIVGKPLSEDLDKDTRVVFDIALPQIGGRGNGGELFALEQGIIYHEKVLPKCAWEFGELKMSGKLRMSPPDIRRHGDALTSMVLARLAKTVDGTDNFCRYCGKDGVETRCSKCKAAHFCKDCQALGWKYHKVWCKP